MPKPCPECKSSNTRQMDKETFGDYAYCLKCYNKFKSYQKVSSVKAAKKSLRAMHAKETRIKTLKRKLEELESEMLSCKEQEFTGAR